MTGQQQGLTCGAAIATGGVCRLPAQHWGSAPCEPYPAPSPTPPARDSCTCLRSFIHNEVARQTRSAEHLPACPMHAGNCCTPARESGRDEAREAVARWLEREYGPRVDPLDSFPGLWKTDADELLALPELDKLLRRPV